MATDSAGKVAPPFLTPPSAAGRWQGNYEMYCAPNQAMSGNIPQEPPDMPVEPTAGNGNPWRDLK